MPEFQPIAVTIPESNWPDEIANGIFIQWCIHLATTELGLPQWSDPDSTHGSLILGNPTSNHFVITPTAPLSWEVTEIIDMDRGALEAIIATAAEKTGANDTGTDLVYQTTMKSCAPPLDMSMMLNMFRILGDQVRIVGSRRLSDVVLLDFNEDLPPLPGQLLFAPDVQVVATLFLPGPAPGYLARGTAGALFETVSAICALALGRPVEVSDLAHFPLQPEAAEVQKARRYEVSILGLAHSSISLDIFGELMALGGPDAMMRARNSFITFHEAQRQTSADIATMLYVSGIEALITPGRQHDWRKEQVTRRFREGVLSLCSDAVDGLLAHPNLEKALDFRKHGKIKWQRRKILDHIYDLRSLPTHTGIGPSRGGVMLLGGDHGLRVALLSDLARAALLAYLQAPRSFLTGHPALQRQQNDQDVL
jgi:hypothetical protein